MSSGSPPSAAAEPTTPTEGSLRRASTTESTRRCFVCLMDEGDAAGPSDNWVNPCPCTLAAHHECMLMFVADCESQLRPLRCPICKSPIQLVQPFDPAIWLSKTCYAVMCRVSPYVLALLFTSGTLAGSASYGLASLAVFAGPRDTLATLWNGSATGLEWYKRVHWGSAVHLPFIGPTLFLNRFVRVLGYSVALPNFASYVVCARLAPHDELFRWPPSPYWIMAINPAVRMLYFSMYKDLFGNLEKRLEREYRAIQGNSRQNEPVARDNDAAAPPGDAHENEVQAQEANPDAPPAGAENAAAAAAAEPVVVAQAQFRANVGEGWADAILGFLGADDDDEWEDIAEEDEHEHPRPGHRHRRRRRRQRVGNNMQEQIIDIVEEEMPGDGQDGGGGNNHNNNNNQQQQQEMQGNNNNNGGGDFPALIDIANALVRSLLFPGFAFLGGELLRLALPKAWCQRPASGSRPTGLLQLRWGRSLVGGCLYVVLRDLLRLWVKYRVVTVYPQRRVKDLGKHKPRRGGRVG